MIGVVLSFVNFIPYGYGIYKHSVRPHQFTWLIWSIVTIIAAAGQVTTGAGPSAWCTAVIAFTCLITFIISIFRGDPKHTRFDWFCLISALAAIPVWVMMKDATIAVCIVTLIELFGFLPTMRKTWFAPWSESLSYFVVSEIKYIAALLALQSWSLGAAVYPVTITIAGICFCSMIIFRRLQMPRPTTSQTEP